MTLFEKLNKLDDSLVESKRAVKKKKLTESTEQYELSTLVKDSINHLVNGLGRDPMADDFGDDVCADLENNYDIDVPQNPVKYADWCYAVMSEVSRQLNNKEKLTEGNNVSSQLPPSIDDFLQDIAQMYGTITYKDIMEHEYTEEDLKKLKNYRRRFRAEVPYEGDEETDNVLKKIANRVAQIVKSENILESRNNPYFAPYGYRDAAKVLNGKAPEYYYHLKEIEMDKDDGVKLARYALRKGLPVMVDKNSDPDYPEFAIKGEYHWNDYFYPYPTAHEEDLVAWDGKMFVEEQLTESSYDPYPAGKYGDLIFKILDSCSGDAIINFMNEYKWPFYESGDSISDVYDKINKYLDTHSGYGLWSDLDKHFN